MEKKKGKQNHICVDCGRQFIDCYDPPKGYSDEVKRECLKMYVNGMGFRALPSAPAKRVRASQRGPSHLNFNYTPCKYCDRTHLELKK